MSAPHDHDDAGPSGPASRRVPYPCPTCGAASSFVAHFGAPGVGQAWVCEAGHDLVLLRGSFFAVSDTPAGDEPAWVLDEDDVR